MSEVCVSLSNGRTFELKGDRAGGRLIIDVIKAAAEKYGLTFDDFTHTCLAGALRGDEHEDKDEACVALAIVAYILQRNTGHQEYPGRFVGHLGTTDFKFHIVGDDEGLNIRAMRRVTLHS